MPIPPFTKKKPSGRNLSLALQGGGAHGAFEWGILDRLLEEEDLEIRAVTAASAGAMNAVCLAQGLIEDGKAGARAKLDAFWKQVNRQGGRNVFGDTSIWTNAFAGGADWLKSLPGWRMAETFALSLSPYEFNPFNLNPLHDTLEAEIDFGQLREKSPIKLYIAATAVRTSKSVIFRETELTVRHIMASACLPQVFQAVEIDGEPYWDGGYLANPALWPLIHPDTPDDILILPLNPFVRNETPHAAGEIMDRLNEIVFNAPLVSELRAFALLQSLIADGQLKTGSRHRVQAIRMHAIESDRWLGSLSLGSKFDTEWTFLNRLKGYGREAAEAWLADCFDAVGERSSVDVKARFL